MRRECGECTLCCKLIAVYDNEPWRGGAPIDKPAGVRCPHQRHKGCNIYAARPYCCKLWSCRWLVGDDTADLSRPDRSHYVIDIMPDYATVRHNETGEELRLPVVQVWIDPKYPDAHRDPALRRYLERRAAEGYGAIIRYDDNKAMTLFAPAMTETGEWREVWDGRAEAEHTLADKLEALGPMRIVT